MPTDGGLTDEELREQMITLLVAGHETTATALAWVFHYMLENPSVLATLRAELDAGPLTPDRAVRLDPTRFIGRRPSPYEFLPFGGGTRRCLGIAFAFFEMKVVLAEVLARAELRPAPGYRMRMIRRAITLAPSEGLPLVVERRAA